MASLWKMEIPIPPWIDHVIAPIEFVRRHKGPLITLAAWLGIAGLAGVMANTLSCTFSIPVRHNNTDVVLEGIVGWISIWDMLAHPVDMAQRLFLPPLEAWQYQLLMAWFISLFLYEAFLYILAASVFHAQICWRARRPNPWFVLAVAIPVLFRVVAIYFIVLFPFAGDATGTVLAYAYTDPLVLISGCLLLFLLLMAARIELRHRAGLPWHLRFSQGLLFLWLIELAVGAYAYPALLLRYCSFNSREQVPALVAFARLDHAGLMQRYLRRHPEAISAHGAKAVNAAIDRQSEMPTILLLLDGAGVPIDARDEKGQTALMRAAAGDYAPAGDLLIARGANVNAQDYEGKTPLMHTSRYLYYRPPRIMSLLLDRGAEINAKDNRGWTPLMHAAYRGHWSLVKMLVARGADINAVNDSGQRTSDLLLEDLKRWSYDWDEKAKILEFIGGQSVPPRPPDPR